MRCSEKTPAEFLAAQHPCLAWGSSTLPPPQHEIPRYTQPCLPIQATRGLQEDYDKVGRVAITRSTGHHTAQHRPPLELHTRIHKTDHHELHISHDPTSVALRKSTHSICHHVIHLLYPLAPRRPPLHPRLRHLPLRRRRRSPLHARRARHGPLHPALLARHRRRGPMGSLHLRGLSTHVPQTHRQVPELLRLVLDHGRQHTLPAAHAAARRGAGSWWCGGWAEGKPCGGKGRHGRAV